MSKNLSVSLSIKLQGSALRELGSQFKTLTKETSSYTAAVAKANKENLTLAATFKLLITEGKSFASVLGQLSGQSTLLGGRSRTLSGDVNLVGRSLQNGARDAERMRRELERLRQVPPPRPLPPNGGGSGGRVGTGGGWGSTATGIATGAMAAYAIVRSPLERARSFETQIFDATTSITGGYKGMNSAQAKAENLLLSKYAKDAVRQGHGTVEGIGDSAGILASSGLYQNIGELKIPLKATAKTAFAAGAEEQDIARLTVQVKQFDIAAERTQAALDRLTSSGYAGGFEIKAMSRYLPEVLPFAKGAGYSGEEGLNKVSTHLQLARKYTGIDSQAADNMRDLYSLFTQGHFALSIGKYIKPEAGDPITKIGLRGNRAGFDVTKYLADQKEQGIDSVIAIASLMNRQLSKNPRFVQLQKQIAEAEKSGNTDKSTTYKKEAMNIVAAGEFGKIFHNQQSLLGIMSIIAGINNGEFKRIDEVSWNGVGSVDRVAGLKSEIEPAQAHALQQESILATIKVYDSLKGTLGTFEGGLKNTMEANQALTASAYAAATALGIFAAFKIGSMMGGAAGGALGGAAAGAGIGALLMRTLTMKNGLGRLGAIGLTGYAGWEGGQYFGDRIYKKYYEGNERGDWVGEKMAQLASFLPEFIGGNDAREAIKFREQNKELFELRPNFEVKIINQMDSQQVASHVETTITRKAQRQ